MASSFITSALQVNFESVLEITDKEGMVTMFRALEASALVQDGDITGAISGKFFAISQPRFAEVFELPTEGLVDFSEVPKELVYDARSIFSKSGEPVSSHGKKRLMKYEFRLLNDILAKAITVKAGSFDVVTNERFFTTTAIHFGIKVNWRKILFGILKEMVDRTLKRARGFTAQICVLLKSNPAVTVGEVMPFPSMKILSMKTVHTYITMNETIDARGKSDEPGMGPVAIVKRKSQSKKKSESTGEAPVEVVTEVVGSKKRPTVMGDEAAIPKKRRTMKSKASPPKRVSKKRRLQVTVEETVKEIVEETIEEQSVEPSADTFEKDTVSVADDVDDVIAQVLTDTAHLETDNADDLEQWFEDFVSRDTEPLIESDRVLDREQGTAETVADAQPLQTSVEKETVEKAEGSKDVVVAKAFERAVGSNQTDEELMYIDDLLMQISDNMMLPSVTAAEVTKIRFGSSIEINEVQDRDWYYASLPRISTHDKGKEPLEEDEFVKGNPAREMVQLICGDVDFLVHMRDQVDMVQRPDSQIPTVDSPMRFNSDDLSLDDTTDNQFSLPAVTTELSASLDDLRTFLSQRLYTQTKCQASCS
ncbi:hypothetical protein F511_40114 [Dorcoceras hygrometricum]|uniref:Dystroglycan-like n=1 Tax=Dorcoceras hygrometricum TaxID=472368 RepID=A0A2Z7C626_9LAMI|nr:hypothetical protein F511_40114 [Dorcoceras hygrometricum]